MNEFSLGDQVSLLIDHPEGNPELWVGNIGTIVRDPEAEYIGVDWGKYMDQGHTCEDACPEGQGWWVHKDLIVPVIDRALYRGAVL